MSKILVIGAAGLLGAQVVDALGESECIRASRNSGERVDISDPRSLAALFERVGELDGIVCTGGAARYKAADEKHGKKRLAFLNSLKVGVHVGFVTRQKREARRARRKGSAARRPIAASAA